MTEFVQFVSPYLPAHIFDIIMVPMQIILLLFTLYFFFIGFCCLWRRKEQKILTPEKTFAVVVAAHNEAAVIGQLIENLKRLDYPEELYDIYVIADNCTDETAQIAGDAGAIVCERTHPTKKSKGFALEWMFERLFEMDKEYDAIAIFDADNLVHPNFLCSRATRSFRDFSMRRTLMTPGLRGRLQLRSGSLTTSPISRRRTSDFPRASAARGCALQRMC